MTNSSNVHDPGSSEFVVRTALVGSIRVEFVDVGSGPVVLLVHGAGGSWQAWQQNLATLSKNHRLIVPSLPGCGRSDRLRPKPVDLEPYVHTLAGLLGQLGIDSATVVGHSLGGILSLRLAADWPTLVNKLVLVDSAGAKMSRTRMFTASRSIIMMRYLCTKPWFVNLVTNKPNVRRRALSSLVHDPVNVGPAFLATGLSSYAAAGVPESVMAGARDPIHSRLADIRVSTTVIWGREDRLIPLQLGVALATALPNATLEILDNTGHCPMFEQPQEFERLLQAALIR